MIDRPGPDFTGGRSEEGEQLDGPPSDILVGVRGRPANPVP